MIKEYFDIVSKYWYIILISYVLIRIVEILLRYIFKKIFKLLLIPTKVIIKNAKNISLFELTLIILLLICLLIIIYLLI